jgi:hypothetical protein
MLTEGLGHEYGNSITGIYLNDYNSEEVDEMNFRIIEDVMKKQPPVHFT